MIQVLHKNHCSNREIARRLHCSPSTVTNELKRGTPPRTGKRGRPFEYSAQRGQAVYTEHRKSCHRRPKLRKDSPFFRWVRERVASRDKWSLDVCAGYAKRHHLFIQDQMVCSRSLYHALWNGRLGLTSFDLPEALGRKKHRLRGRRNKRLYGRSIDERPAEVSAAAEFGHWEIDTVVGRRAGKEAVILTLLEKQTRYLLAIKLPGKTSEAVQTAMKTLHEAYHEHFTKVFRSITSDNGTEFSELSQCEGWGTRVYFAHPYSSWERPQNERHNRFLRRYLPKGKSIEQFSPEQIQWYSDEINSLPRKVLNYQTPEDLFDRALDQLYSVGSTVC